MDTIHLEMHGVCMKSRSIRMSRPGAEAVLNFCREHDVNVYRLFDSFRDVQSLLPMGEHAECLEECYMYCNDKPDVYAYVNERQTEAWDFGAFPNIVRNLDQHHKSEDHIVMEKATINDGIMVFEIGISQMDRSGIQNLSLALKKSVLDNSLLLNEVYYGDNQFRVKHVELFPGPIQAINVRYKGRKAWFIDVLNKDFMNIAGIRTQNMITEISRTIQ